MRTFLPSIGVRRLTSQDKLALDLNLHLEWDGFEVSWFGYGFTICVWPAKGALQA